MTKLSPEISKFFKENGYLIMRGVLDPELMDQARESLWSNALSELDRNDPTTWVGPFERYGRR